MRLRRLITLAFVAGLLLSVPLAAEARSRSRGADVDVAVTDVTATESVGVGQSVSVEATITGTGGRTASVTVDLSVSPGGESQTTSVGISAGETETVSFSWTPSNTGVFTSTVTAAASGDPDPSNNSGSAETQVVGANEITVSGFDVSVEGANQISGQVDLEVPSTSRYRRSPLQGGTATIRYTGLPGQTGTTTATINGTGTVEFEFTVDGNGGVPPCYTIEIVDVERSGFAFDPAGAPTGKAYPEPASIYNAPSPFFGIIPLSSETSSLDAMQLITPSQSPSAAQIEPSSIVQYALNGDELNAVPLEENGFYSGLATTVDGRIFAVRSVFLSPADSVVVDVYDSDLNMVDSFPLPEGFFATDITIGGDGTLYISGVPELFLTDATLGELQDRQSSQQELPEGQILRYDQQGNPIEPAWPSDAVTFPESIQVSPDGNVYVSDIDFNIEAEEVAGVIRKFTPDGTLVDTFALADPESIALDLAADCDGNLYATDPLHQQLLIFDSDGNLSTLDEFGGINEFGDFRPLAVQVGGENQGIYVGGVLLGEGSGFVVIDESGNLVDGGFGTDAPGRFTFGY